MTAYSNWLLISMMIYSMIACPCMKSRRGYVEWDARKDDGWSLSLLLPRLAMTLERPVHHPLWPPSRPSQLRVSPPMVHGIYCASLQDLPNHFWHIKKKSYFRHFSILLLLLLLLCKLEKAFESYSLGSLFLPGINQKGLISLRWWRICAMYSAEGSVKGLFLSLSQPPNKYERCGLMGAVSTKKPVQCNRIRTVPHPTGPAQ